MKRAFIVTDLAFGDSGKGTITDALCRQYNASMVVRFNGGPQAAHAVVCDDGREHVFSHFGSGTFVPGVKTLIGPGMLINPLNAQVEEQFLQRVGVRDAFNRLFIDNGAMVITPFHRALNRLQEYARGKDCHGSCGMGIGTCMADALETPGAIIFAHHLLKEDVVRQKIRFARDRMLTLAAQLDLPKNDKVKEQMDTFLIDENVIIERYKLFARQAQFVDREQIATMLNCSQSVVFEGAQGVLLDEYYGFHPHTTWSTTTSRWARLMLEEANYPGETIEVGVLRTYLTRHGAGPFPTEEKSIGNLIADDHNGVGEFQGSLRAGYLDIPLLQYAIDVNGCPDVLAITHCDKLPMYPNWRVCMEYANNVGLTKSDVPNLVHQEAMTKRLFGAAFSTVEVPSQEVPELVEQSLATPILIESHGKRYCDKIFAEL